MLDNTGKLNDTNVKIIKGVDNKAYLVYLIKEDNKFYIFKQKFYYFNEKLLKKLIILYN